MAERCVIVCRRCSSAAAPLLMPFSSYRERALWAEGHTARSGHDTWICMDGFPSMAEVVQEMTIADTVDRWIDDRP